MKYEEMAGMSASELTNKRKDMRQQLFNARMKNALGQLANPMEIRELRRSIARIKTAASASKAVKAAPKARKAGAKG